MRKIVLLCNGGLSTSILMRRMKAAAERISYDCEISAAPVSCADEAAMDADLVLLGPQVWFELEPVKGQVGCPVLTIDSAVYGMMNGEAVLNQVRKELGD